MRVSEFIRFVEEMLIDYYGETDYEFIKQVVIRLQRIKEKQRVDKQDMKLIDLVREYTGWEEEK
ncbi:hypothetical protein [Hydrogenobacter thermophilus]|uniref:hypothetical protein n=1 Tax=Hydrogenobacter thermophilus TaxID=940 RepID=UPI0030FA9267